MSIMDVCSRLLHTSHSCSWSHGGQSVRTCSTTRKAAGSRGARDRDEDRRDDAALHQLDAASDVACTPGCVVQQAPTYESLQQLEPMAARGVRIHSAARRQNPVGRTRTLCVPSALLSLLCAPCVFHFCVRNTSWQIAHARLFNADPKQRLQWRQSRWRGATTDHGDTTESDCSGVRAA